MFQATNPAPRPGAGKNWLPLVLMGSIAIVAGIFLPRLLGGGVVPPSAEKPKETFEVKKDAPEVKKDAPEVKTSDLEYTPPDWPEQPDPRAMLTRLGIGTAIVLILCVGSMLLGRKWLRRLSGQGTGGVQMSLVETLPLGGRCALHLVRVGKQQVLVGIDASGVKSLVALPEVFDDTLAAASSEGQPSDSAPATLRLVGAEVPAQESTPASHLPAAAR
jgi:flagellar biogenesis protein FliO